MSIGGHLARRYNPPRTSTQQRRVMTKTAVCRDCQETFSWTGVQGAPRKRCDPCREVLLRAVRKERYQHRRARLRGASEAEPINPMDIYIRDGWTCHICQQPTLRQQFDRYEPMQPTLDHVIPLAAGGSHTAGNVKTAHFLCNAIKSDK